MKKIGSIVSVVVLVGILLSSCTSQKNGLAIKRKYNKGYYIAHNHKKSNLVTKDSNSDKVVKATENKVVSLAEVEMPAIKTIISTVNHETIPVEKAEKINEVKHNTIISDSKNATASSVDTKVKTSHKTFVINNKSESKAKTTSGDSDTMTILLVILCIFPILALIAMFLHDGNSITLNFWVDLLLHLTVIGYIIFGILVVLDLVNLA